MDGRQATPDHPAREVWDALLECGHAVTTYVLPDAGHPSARICERCAGKTEAEGALLTRRVVVALNLEAGRR